MISSHAVNGFTITQRGGLVASIKDAELFISNNNVDFTSAGTFVFANTNGPQNFDFSAVRNFRFFKIVASTSWDGQQYGALAEIGMY